MCRCHQLLAFCLPHVPPVGGVLATDIGFDPIQRGDAGQCLRRDRRRSGLGLVVEATAHVAPAVNQRYARPVMPSCGQLLVYCIAIALQDATVRYSQKPKPKRPSSHRMWPSAGATISLREPATSAWRVTFGTSI